eukprot:TRINITY_DN5373_c0_g1_i2.p1 TRINITY_DN5373_c0_g1~~TRINITY_DN5373_c0_g1_i2.p1  ORF type:complete len:115 (-),score=28.85 TRINITY_DN5373_c0_g1_i2:32-376(-)
MKGMTSMRPSPHIVGDNVQTHFDNVRLVKGEPPGRAQCNYYTGQLGTLKVSHDWRKSCHENHMKNIAGGNFNWGSTDLGEGGTPADGKFFDPKRIESIVGSMKFVNPERTIPVI